MSVCLTYEGGLYVLIILGILMILCGIGIALTCDNDDPKRKEVRK